MPVRPRGPPGPAPTLEGRPSGQHCVQRRELWESVSPPAQDGLGRACPRPLTPPFLPQEQFAFALTAVAEEVNAILKALPQ